MAEEVTVEAWNEYFSSCVCVCVCVAPVHTCGLETQEKIQALGNEKKFLFLHWHLCLRLHLHYGSSHVCLLVLAFVIFLRRFYNFGANKRWCP